MIANEDILGSIIQRLLLTVQETIQRINSDGNAATSPPTKYYEVDEAMRDIIVFSKQCMIAKIQQPFDANLFVIYGLAVAIQEQYLYRILAVAPLHTDDAAEDLPATDLVCMLTLFHTKLNSYWIRKNNPEEYNKTIVEAMSMAL